MKLVVEEFSILERDGIELSGNGTVYPIIIGNKGDWSYLAAWENMVDVFHCFPSQGPP